MSQFMHCGRTLVALVLFTCSVNDAKAAARLKPDRIDIGVVRVGAIVETNARIYWEKPEPGGSEPSVETPSFARLMGIVARRKVGGPPVTEVNLTIDTTELGEFEDVVHVTYGTQSVEIPLIAVVRERDATLREVLIADTPFDSSSTLHASTFDRWRELVASSPLAPNYLVVPFEGPVFRDMDLSRFDVILLAENGIHGLSREDIDQLQQFVAKGGRAILTAIGFHRGTVPIVNSVATQHGIEMFVSSPTVRGRDRIEIDSRHIMNHPLTEGVAALSVRQHTPITVTDPTRASILVAAPDGSGNAYLARSSVESGEMIVFTNYLWWIWINDSRMDNAKLLENLLAMPVVRNSP